MVVFFVQQVYQWQQMSIPFGRCELRRNYLDIIANLRSGHVALHHVCSYQRRKKRARLIELHLEIKSVMRFKYELEFSELFKYTV